ALRLPPVKRGRRAKAALVRSVAVVTRRVHPRGTFRLLLRLHHPERRGSWAVETVVTTHSGLRLPVSTASFVEWVLFFFGTYESEVVDVIRAHLGPGDCAIDVGANV